MDDLTNDARATAPEPDAVEAAVDAAAGDEAIEAVGLVEGAFDAAELEVEYADLLAVRLGGKTFLLPARDVAEIVRPMRLTPVPMAPDHLLGVGNVHGQVVCVIEACRQMVLPEAPLPDGEDTRYVVLRHARMRVAIRVDAVPAIYRIRVEELDAMPRVDGEKGVRGRLQVEGVEYDVLDARALMEE